MVEINGDFLKLLEIGRDLQSELVSVALIANSCRDQCFQSVEILTIVVMMIADRPTRVYRRRGAIRRRSNDWACQTALNVTLALRDEWLASTHAMLSVTGQQLWFDVAGTVDNRRIDLSG